MIYKKILLIICILIAACGGETKRPKDATNRGDIKNVLVENQNKSVNLQDGKYLKGQKLKFSTVLDAKKAVEGYSLSCEDQDHCPEAVGVAFLFQGTEAIQCTAFLIAEDLVVTNEHCFTNAGFDSEKNSCATNIIFSFPKSKNSPAENIECDKIVTTSKTIRKKIITKANTTYLPDFVVTKLKTKTKRAVAKFSQEPIIHNEELYIHKAVLKDRVGLVTSQKCLSTKKALTKASVSLNDSPTFLLKNCKVEDGASGSPVSRADGQVVGVIQGELDYDTAQDKAKLKEMNINEAQSSIFGTSASCITNEKKCLYNDVQEMENFNKEIADQKVALQAEMEKTLKTFIGEHSKLAEWKIVDVPIQKINSFNKSDLVLAAKIALPQCLKNKNGVTSTNFETQIVVMNQVINPDLEYEFNTEVRMETIKLKVINQNNLEVRYNNPFQLKSEVVKLSGRCQ